MENDQAQSRSNGASVARILREGSSEPLSKAKQALKERLRQRIEQQVVEEFRETGSTVETMAADVLAQHDDLFRQVADDLKDRLREQLLQQVLEELEDDAQLFDIILERIAESDGVRQLRQRLKERLLEHMMEQVLEEIQDEVEVQVGKDEDDSEVADLDVTDNVREEADEQDRDFFLREEVTESTTANPEPETAVPNEPDPPSRQNGKDGVYAASRQGPSGDGSPSDASADPTPSVGQVSGRTADGRTMSTGSEKRARCLYVHGVYKAGSSERTLPPSGMEEGVAPFVVSSSGLAALVSTVAGEEFEGERLSVHLQDEEWRRGREERHRVVVRQAASHGTFLPLPFPTVCESEDDVAALLDAHQDQYCRALERLEGRQEWALKVYRNVETLRSKVVEKSEKVRDLMADIKRKPRGVARFIKKQMVSTIHEEVELITDTCVKQCHERLLVLAEDGEVGTFEEGSQSNRGELILDASYLLLAENQKAFRDTVEALSREYGDLGFYLELVGPMPPVTFFSLPSADGMVDA